MIVILSKLVNIILKLKAIEVLNYILELDKIDIQQHRIVQICLYGLLVHNNRFV